MARPQGAARNSILETAERLFAEYGFDGVSLRKIASDANSQLALIHYHFGSKGDLYRAVWSAWFQNPVMDQSPIEQVVTDPERSVEDKVRTLVDMFLRPLAMMLELPRGRLFMTIMAREHADPREAERGLLQEFLDPPTAVFTRAFQRTLPELSAIDVAWGMRMTVGLAQSMLLDSDRTLSISQGAIDKRELSTARVRLARFIASGWMDLHAQHHTPARSHEGVAG